MLIAIIEWTITSEVADGAAARSINGWIRLSRARVIRPCNSHEERCRFVWTWWLSGITPLKEWALGPDAH